MHERERETISPIMDGGRVGQVWVGMLVFHVGASLLLPASCGFYIGLLLEACLWSIEQWIVDGPVTHAYGKATP
jgi:hypothetical protein